MKVKCIIVVFVVMVMATMVTGQINERVPVSPPTVGIIDPRLQDATNIFQNSVRLIQQIARIDFGEDYVFPKLRAAMDWAWPRLPAVTAVNSNLLPVMEPFPRNVGALEPGQAPLYFPNPTSLNGVNLPVYVPFRRRGVRFPLYFPFDKNTLTLRYPEFPVYYQYEKQVNAERFPVWISYQRNETRSRNIRPAIGIPFQQDPSVFPMYVHFNLQTEIPGVN
ncbi:hypothetical protein FSP39_024970 [Pinctada imbricata]|uniref:Uncharacterized protein n=1 Tax=Pinctada imbricata TaxID=66713 RepID=A0AA88Y9A7_PINIB|nr:hypothetical protein FSP39_024970 [Pinctada imbricata]